MQLKMSVLDENAALMTVLRGIFVFKLIFFSLAL